MKNLLTKLAMLSVLGVTLVSCNGSVSVGTDSEYVCYPVYDSWGYYLYDDCYWEYYNVSGDVVSKELDIAAAVSDVEQFKLERMSKHYAEKFSMSADEAMQVSKNVLDLNALEDRNAEDYADFAVKLYGVNPSEVVSAVGKAQMGQNAELNSLIDSIDFSISSQNKKALIKELHGNALKANGIEL